MAANLGDSQLAVAVATHLRATGTEGWRRLPAEHRAAHLIDITHAHLDAGDPAAAVTHLATAIGLATLS